MNWQLLTWVYLSIAGLIAFAGIKALPRIKAKHQQYGMYWSDTKYKWVNLGIALLWLPCLVLYGVLNALYDDSE